MCAKKVAPSGESLQKDSPSEECCAVQRHAEDATTNSKNHNPSNVVQKGQKLGCLDVDDIEPSPLRPSNPSHCADDEGHTILLSPEKGNCSHQMDDVPKHQRSCNSCELERSLSDAQLLKERIRLVRHISVRKRCNSLNDQEASISWFRHRSTIKSRNLKRSMSTGCTVPGNKSSISSSNQSQKLTILPSPTDMALPVIRRVGSFSRRVACFPALPTSRTHTSSTSVRRRLLSRRISTSMIPTHLPSPKPKRIHRSNSIPLKQISNLDESTALDFFDWTEYANKHSDFAGRVGTPGNRSGPPFPTLPISSPGEITLRKDQAQVPPTVSDIYHWENHTRDEQDGDDTRTTTTQNSVGNTSTTTSGDQDVFDWKQWAQQHHQSLTKEEYHLYKPKRSSEPINFTPSMVAASAGSAGLDKSTRSDSSYFVPPTESIST